MVAVNEATYWLALRRHGIADRLDGHGILLRLLIGDPVTELLDDDLLLLEISQTAPRVKVPEPDVKDAKQDADDESDEAEEVEAHA